MTRDEHLKHILIVGSQTRGKRHGLLMLCSGPECAGAEMFARGLKVADVLVAAEAHIADCEADESEPHCGKPVGEHMLRARPRDHGFPPCGFPVAGSDGELAS